MSVPRHRKDRESLHQTARASAADLATTEHSPTPAERLASSPSYDDIARRAYQLFEERGGEPGRDWEDWFRAEREL